MTVHVVKIKLAVIWDWFAWLHECLSCPVCQCFLFISWVRSDAAARDNYADVRASLACSNCFGAPVANPLSMSVRSRTPVGECACPLRLSRTPVYARVASTSDYRARVFACPRRVRTRELQQKCRWNRPYSPQTLHHPKLQLDYVHSTLIDIRCVPCKITCRWLLDAPRWLLTKYTFCFIHIFCSISHRS